MLCQIDYRFVKRPMTGSGHAVRPVVVRFGRWIGGRGAALLARSRAP